MFKLQITMRSPVRLLRRISKEHNQTPDDYLWLQPLVHGILLAFRPRSYLRIAWALQAFVLSVFMYRTQKDSRLERGGATTITGPCIACFTPLFPGPLS